MSFDFKNPDLHMHSVFSDGTDTPQELIANVKAAGVDIFALTDHDSYAGCEEVRSLLKEGDPFFIGGVELSCKDSIGKYHVLGYCYSLEKPSLRQAVQKTHDARMEKAVNRIKYLEEYGFPLSAEDKEYLLSLKNPGKPHISALLMKKGYIKDIREGFSILSGYRGNELSLSPEDAIDAVLQADGIPVLAHGILADGSKNLTAEQIEERVSRLKKCGLMGLECYYSGYTEEQQKIMLALAEKYNLLVTAGSDYHGINKKVRLADTHSPDPEKMKRFYTVVKMLLSE